MRVPRGGFSRCVFVVEFVVFSPFPFRICAFPDFVSFRTSSAGDRSLRAGLGRGTTTLPD
jgi:hypothetical protein